MNGAEQLTLALAIVASETAIRLTRMLIGAAQRKRADVAKAKTTQGERNA